MSEPFFYLFENTSVCFEQFDGSISQSLKAKVVFTLAARWFPAHQRFKKILLMLWCPYYSMPCKTPPVLFIPPLPRYLFAHCCDDPSHCTNSSQPALRQRLLSEFMQLRNVLIRHLVKPGLKNIIVMDTCCTATCTNTANASSRLAELRHVTAKDGVHFVSISYWNLATRTLACLVSMLIALWRPQKAKCHFWRGFKSTRGSSALQGRGPTQGNRSGRGSPRGNCPPGVL